MQDASHANAPPSSTPTSESRPFKVQDNDIVTRAAVAGDIDALVRIEVEVFDTDRISRRSFRHFLLDPRSTLIVADWQGQVAGYAVVLYRRGTGIARLYSIASALNSQGTGVGAHLLAAAETDAFERDALLLRLEVRVDNDRAIRFYESHGYRSFGRHLDYYEDHTDAVRLQKRLTGTPRINPRRVPYRPQSTEFTCGPACMTMAMAALRPSVAPNLALELRLWRESTTIFMTAGHGGCEPLGMAIALARRGFRPTVHVSEEGPYFLDGVRDPRKKTVMALVQAEFAIEARALGIPIEGPISAEGVAEAVAQGAVAIALVSHYRMVGDKAPHWILIHDLAGRHLYAHDPWIDTDTLETAVAAIDMPIPFAEFDRMARYGARRLQATLLIRESDKASEP